MKRSDQITRGFTFAAIHAVPEQKSSSVLTGWRSRRPPANAENPKKEAIAETSLGPSRP